MLVVGTLRRNKKRKQRKGLSGDFWVLEGFIWDLGNVGKEEDDEMESIGV